MEKDKIEPITEDKNYGWIRTGEGSSKRIIGFRSNPLERCPTGSRDTSGIVGRVTHNRRKGKWSEHRVSGNMEC